MIKLRWYQTYNRKNGVRSEPILQYRDEKDEAKYGYSIWMDVELVCEREEEKEEDTNS